MKTWWVTDFVVFSSLILTCFTTTWRTCLRATPRCLRWRSVRWWSPWSSSVTSLRTLPKRRLFWRSWCPPWLHSGLQMKWRRACWVLFPLPVSSVLLNEAVWHLAGTFCSVLCDPAAFLSYVGADQVVTKKSEGTDTAGLNRARVSDLMQLRLIYFFFFCSSSHHFLYNLSNPSGAFPQAVLYCLVFFHDVPSRGSLYLTAANCQHNHCSVCVGKQRLFSYQHKCRLCLNACHLNFSLLWPSCFRHPLHVLLISISTRTSQT